MYTSHDELQSLSQGLIQFWIFEFMEGKGMSDWNEVGVRAFNFYFNCFRKTEDYDQSLDDFDSEIVEKMEEEGIDFEEGWQFDLPSDAITSILAGVIKQSKEHGDGDTIGALHTHIVDKLFEAQDTHGEDQFNEWNKLLEEMLG
jgi:hypothetical protein